MVKTPITNFKSISKRDKGPSHTEGHPRDKIQVTNLNVTVLDPDKSSTERHFGDTRIRPTVLNQLPSVTCLANSRVGTWIWDTEAHIFYTAGGLSLGHSMNLM